jgi:iron complex transport system ATP-binding protein
MELKVDNVDFSYNHKKVFSGLSVDFLDDGLIAIAGNNGSGKSTLLKLLAGITKPSAGCILIDGTDYKKIDSRILASKIAYVPQFLDTFFDLQVIDFLLTMGQGRRYGVDKERFEKAYNALERVGIQDFAQRNINHLSGGERQKVLIANALNLDTDIILLDEPVSHLDWKSQIEIFKLLNLIATEEKRKVIVVVHDINLAAEYSFHILLMEKNGAVTYGKTSEVLNPESIRNVFGLEVRNLDGHFIPVKKI